VQQHAARKHADADVWRLGPAIAGGHATGLDRFKPERAGRARVAAPERPFSETPEDRLEEVESLLRERQRAFIELVGTTELLRRKVAQLEERLSKRNDELARLRQSARERD